MSARAPSFYIIITDLGKVDVQPPKQRKVGEVADAPFEVVQVEDDRFSYSSTTSAKNYDCSVRAVH